MKQNIKSIVVNAASALLIVVLGISVLAQDNNQQGQGRGQGRGRMGGMGMGQGQPQDMKTIHALFDDHKKIQRSVKNIENGVETVTESDDPKVKALIIEHSWAMKARLEKKQPIRQWDPLFAELFKHADKIKMEIANTAKGVKVTETSADPYVVKLIQSHAAGVSEFVSEGMSVMHKQHDLPGATKKEDAAFIGKGDGITTCPVTGEPVNKDIKYGFFGRTVYFCCENCLEAAKKNPELYLKPNLEEGNMRVLKLQTEIGEGKDKQVEMLFSGSRRQLVQITLRNNAILESHKADVPITIQCIAGKGTLWVGSPSQTVELRPGVLVTVEPNVLHEVKATSALSILLSKFADK